MHTSICASEYDRPQRDVYDTVFKLLSSHQHRLAGSDSFNSSIDEIERIANQHGIKTLRQSYATMVPKTLIRYLSINGHKSNDIYPLAPNAEIMPTSTGGKTLSAPAYYVGNGTLSDLNGVPIRGSVVIMELGSPHMIDAYSEGAEAIIFVGNKSADRWSCSKHFTTGRQQLPRFFVPREKAKELGLLAAKGEQIELRVDSTWKNTPTSNLIFYIPADQSEKFALGYEEQIVYSATADTFGLIPEYSPDMRKAANVALLVSALIKAQETTGRKRDIIGVIWGSHYAAQEGARHFYQPYHDQQTGQAEEFHYQELKAYYEETLNEQQALSELLHHENPLNFTKHEAFSEFRRLMRDWIRSKLNDTNFDLQQINIALSKQSTEELKKQAEIVTKIRSRYNNLFGHMTEMSDVDRKTIIQEYKKEFIHACTQVRKNSNSYINQLKQSMSNLESSINLQKLFIDKQIALHIELDLSGTKDHIFANAFGQHLLYQGNPKEEINIGGFNRHLSRLSKLFENVNGKQITFVRDMYNGNINPSYLNTPVPIPLNTEVAMAAGIYGYHLQDLGDDMAFDKMPVRTTNNLKDYVEHQAHFLQACTKDSGISVKYNFTTISPHKRYLLHQTRINRLAKGASESEGAAIGGIISVTSRSACSPSVGYSQSAIMRIDAAASFYGPMLSDKIARRFCAAVFDEAGKLTHIGKADGTFTLNVFYAYGGGFFTPYVTDNYDLVLSTYLYNGLGNNKFLNSFDDHNRDERVYYTDKLARFKTTDTSGLLILNDSGHKRDTYYGNGLPLDANVMRNINTVQQSGQDYQTINTRRMNTLRENNISVSTVENMHTLAHYHLADAQTNRANNQLADAWMHEVFGLALSKKAYDPLKQVPKDLTSAIVILLLICIPFAFSLERLICGFTTIHKQIIGFIGFFLISFLILYSVHPAFSISTTPSVIFLAFIIVIMSGMVIKIITGKFKYELMAMQGLTSKSHAQGKTANVGMASVLIGISSMRNRPLKTTLTAFTVVLLTFTVLVFGSFSSQNEVVTSFLGRTPGATQIQVFRNSLLQIPERWRNAVKHRYQDQLLITERSALFHDVTKQNGPYDVYIPAVNPNNGKTLPATALLGLSPDEWNVDNDISKLLSDKVKPGYVHLSESALKNLGLTVGDSITIYGRNFTLGPCFDINAIRSMRYVDNKKIVPPDYLATINDMVGSSRSTTLLNDQMNNIDTSSFRWSANDAVIIGHNQDILSLGGMVNVLIAYGKDDEQSDLDVISQEIAQIFNDPIYLKTAAGDYQYFYTSSYSGSGFSDIWVPLLLGGLIIFSSLLGSIVDREREIYTFSALGLAPPNVAALFFAESSVYAVIGGMGGYLLSQAVASLLNYLSELGIYEAPEMNFSSLNSIYTIVLVMGIVLLSTIYPAIKAGKSANPGIARKWRMPNPENGQLKFVFPFTISDHNLLGIVSFIAEHFENHSDASLGLFAASHVQVLHLNGNDHGLSSHIALSPFDLGISQEFLLESSDSDIPGIKEIHITLTHTGGSPSAWVRNNRQFLDDLRHQFLLWRSLPVESIAYYCSLTQERQVDKRNKIEQQDN